MIIDLLQEDCIALESLRERIISCVSKKHRPWFSPVCLPWGLTQEERAEAFADVARRNQAWTIEVQEVDSIFESLKKYLES